MEMKYTKFYIYKEVTKYPKRKEITSALIFLLVLSRCFLTVLFLIFLTYSIIPIKVNFSGIRENIFKCVLQNLSNIILFLSNTETIILELKQSITGLNVPDNHII